MEIKKRWLFNVLSCTWGGLMTFIGVIISVVLMCCGYWPRRFGWCWLFEIGDNWGGLNLGMVILKSKKAGTDIMEHEHGHAFQNCLFGPLMPIVICIPSVARYWWRRYKLWRGSTNLPDYDAIWFESQATQWGYGTGELRRK